MQRSMKEKIENYLYHHCVLCVCVCVGMCVCVCDWVSSSKLLPVDLQSCCINYELYQITKMEARCRGGCFFTGGEDEYETQACGSTDTHTLHPPALLPPLPLPLPLLLCLFTAGP